MNRKMIQNLIAIELETYKSLSAKIGVSISTLKRIKEGAYYYKSTYLKIKAYFNEEQSAPYGREEIAQ